MHDLRIDEMCNHNSYNNTPQLVMDNPTTFASPFQFEITFECLQELDDDLEWKMLYVGKAADSTQDLVLDEILVGPVPVGINKFVLQADAPDPNQLEELLGVTVVLVTCSYRDREFVRVGYYVNNEYNYGGAAATTTTSSAVEEEGSSSLDAETARPSPPLPLDVTKVTRQILADKPRVTKFPIPWGDETKITTTGPQALVPQPPPGLVGMSDHHGNINGTNNGDNLVTGSADQGQRAAEMDDMEDEELEDDEEDDDDEEDEPDDGNEEDEVDLEDEID